MRKNSTWYGFLRTCRHFSASEKKKTKKTQTIKNTGSYINQQKTQIPATCSCCSHLCYMFCVDHPYCLFFFGRYFSQPFNHSIPESRWPLNFNFSHASQNLGSNIQHQRNEAVTRNGWEMSEHKNSLAQICGGG